MKHVLVILGFLSSLTIQAQEELGNSNKHSNTEIIEMKKIMGVDNSNYKPIIKAVKESYMTFKDRILNSIKVSMTKVDDF